MMNCGCKDVTGRRRLKIEPPETDKINSEAFGPLQYYDYRQTISKL